VSGRGKYNKHAKQRIVVGNIVLLVAVPYRFQQSIVMCLPRIPPDSETWDAGMSTDYYVFEYMSDPRLSKYKAQIICTRRSRRRCSDTVGWL